MVFIVLSACVFAEIRHLYRENPNRPWDEWIPDTIPRDVAKGSSKYSVVVRQETEWSESSLVLHSITINNALLKDFLHRVFEDYDGINTKLKYLDFHAPLHEFYHRWHTLEKLYTNEKDEETRKHLELLYPIVRKEIILHIDKTHDLTANGVISFDYLWAIFLPGSNIYSRVGDQDCLYQVTQTQYLTDIMSTHYFSMLCRYIDCDGKDFGYVSTIQKRQNFPGVKKITELYVFPFHLHSETDSLLEKLNSRGERFEGSNAFNHVTYSGFYIDRDQGDFKRRYAKDDRIIIDPKTYALYNSNPEHHPISPLEKEHVARKQELCDITVNIVHKMTTDRSGKLVELMNVHKRKNKNFHDQSRSLTAEQRLLSTPIVRGFCLSVKKWCEFYIDNIQPIVWSEDAFKRLVLPRDNKAIIHAFVQQKLEGGQGFIMLLSGVPGELRKPLYCMSAGELGEDASDVEQALEKIMELNSRWSSIILLDECDVFLEARTTADVHGNRLVSMFLRQLEYFRGVMFLATNRPTSFDAAFDSRIHLAIDYPELREEDLKVLAKDELNGRQIKNIVKTGRLLAKQQKVSLAMKHIEMVLRVKREGSVFWR
ncbi:hypothetical protein F4810DRAFT_700979 [Camillea tinctor]|nr:hypothetical protein F4810DRAFT_700979 [Camillea tinctor]